MKTQTQKYFSLFIPILMTIGTIALLGLFIILWDNGYESFIVLLMKISHFPDERIEDLKTEYISQSKFQVLRYVSGFVLLASGILTYFLFKYRESIQISTKNVIYQFSLKYQSLWCTYRVSASFYKVIITLIFLLITGLLIWATFSYPLMYDEVFSYLYFVNKGFLVTATYYPGPNNHVFYLLCCNVVDLVLDNPVLIMRLPALLASLITLVLLLLYFTKRFSSIYACFIVLLLFCSYSVFYYSFHGRGYAFQLLFFVLALTSAYEYVRKGEKIYLLVFCLVSVLGCYTIPVFIYPLASLIIFLLIHSLARKDKRKILLIIFISFIIGLITFLLYLPVIFISGIEALVNNSWVKQHSWNEVVMGAEVYFKELHNHFWEIPSHGWLISSIVFIGGSFALYQWRKTSWILLSSLIIITPLLLLILQRVFPFMRVMDYIYLLFAFLLSAILIYILSILNEKVRLFIACILMLTIAGFSLIKIAIETPRSNKYYNDLDLVFKEILGSQVKKVYSGDDAYFLYLQYYSLLKNKELEPVSRSEGEILIIPVNMDYRYNKSENYQLLIENQSVRVYRANRK